MDTVGLVKLDQAVQTIQVRIQSRPDLFANGLCQGRPLSMAANQYFVSHGFDSNTLADWRQTLTETLAHAGGTQDSLNPYFSGDTLLGGFRLCGICEKLYTTRFSIFLLPPSKDRNVYLELGIAIGLGVPFFLIQHHEAYIPLLLEGLSRYTKGGLFRTMRRELAGKIEEYDFGAVRFVKATSSVSKESKYLIGAGGLIDDEDFEGSIIDGIRSTYPNLEALSLTELSRSTSGSGWTLEQLVETIQTSRFAIYRVDEECSPTTFLALGMSIGLNQPFLMICKARREVPQDIRGIGIYQFPNFVSLKREIISIPGHQLFFKRYAS